MAEETNTKPREEQGRSFGQVLADWGKGALEGAANAGSIKGMLPGVVFGGLKGAIYGDEDQKIKDLQTKRLELANKQLEQNIAQSAESHNLSVEGMKTVNKINALKLIDAQNQDDDNAFARAKKDADGIFKRGIGYDNKTFLAQGIIDKNKSIQTANNLNAMYNVFQQDPEKGKRLFARAGWRIENGKDGNYEVTSLDGTRRMPLNQMMEKMSGNVLKRAREAIEAADLFEKTTSLDQCSIRNMITDSGVEKYFTTQGADGKASVDYASAYSAYKDYISANASKVFSDEDLMGHMLSRTLQESLVDNKLTPDEMKMLMPQFAMYLEKFRASVTLPNGGDPRTAMVKLADGTQKDIMTFAKDLKERDRVARGFEQYLNEQHIKKQIAAADVAGKIAESRKKVAQAVKAENEAKGSSGQETENTENWSNTAKNYLQKGKQVADTLGVAVPEIEGKSSEESKVALGVGFSKAESEFANSGNIVEANRVFTQSLENAGWKKEDIPSLWEDQVDDAKLFRLEKEQRSILKQIEDFEENKERIKRDRDERKRKITPFSVMGGADMDRAEATFNFTRESGLREKFEKNQEEINRLRKKKNQKIKSKEIRKNTAEAGSRLVEYAKSNRK
jgi:hypothetical protein